jgi:hypothetical protein
MKTIDEVREDCQRSIDNPQTAGERRIARLTLLLLAEHQRTGKLWSNGPQIKDTTEKQMQDCWYAHAAVERALEGMR